jgi:FixJ family two-component response regulator
VIEAGQRVYVVEDDEAMRDSFLWLLESHGLPVTVFPTAEAFAAAYHDGLRGCLVLDVRMPGMSGLELYERIGGARAALPVVFVTGHGDVQMAVTALKSGALDFIEKPFNDAEMLRLLEHCLAVDRSRAEARRRSGDVARRHASLTEREREVMALVVAGKANRQIADELGISVKTVEVHRSRVMEKMEVDSVAALVRAAAVLASPDAGS